MGNPLCSYDIAYSAACRLATVGLFKFELELRHLSPHLIQGKLLPLIQGKLFPFIFWQRINSSEPETQAVLSLLSKHPPSRPSAQELLATPVFRTW